MSKRDFTALWPICSRAQSHSQCKFHYIHRAVPVFQCVPTASGPVLKKSWLCLLCPLPFPILIHINKIPLSPLFFRLKSASFLRLPVYVTCSSPLTMSVALCWTFSSMSTSSLQQESTTGQSIPDASHKCSSEGKDQLSGPAGNTPNAAQDTFFAKITHCGSCSTWMSTRTLFSAKMLQTLVSSMWASEINDTSLWNTGSSIQMGHTLGIRCLKLLKLSKADSSQCRANINKGAPAKLTNHFSNELPKSEAVNILQGSMKRFIADTLSEAHVTKKCSVQRGF